MPRQFLQPNLFPFLNIGNTVDSLHSFQTHQYYIYDCVLFYSKYKQIIQHVSNIREQRIEQLTILSHNFQNPLDLLFIYCLYAMDVILNINFKCYISQD